ncbi:MAG: three-Cys-motif partner protein TcmP, partial [Paludibacter sp.]|nr:three-Cys-motif partner protein TcmP [Paludibacter sp.]
MAKNINNKAFNGETQLKLDIFRECFREWFPVFLHNRYVSHIYIYDLFAGSGTDAEGKYGSPLILLEEARGEDAKHCSLIKNANKQITFIFNEKENTKKQEKFELLKSNVTSFFSKCKEENDCEQGCAYKYHCTNKGFKDGFYDDSTDFQNILSNNKFAKFLLLDQYGFS